MPKWKIDALEMVDGFKQHLSASAPRSAHMCFDHFRQEIKRARTQREMKAIEQRLEALLGSRSYFRGAARRFIQTGFKRVISNCKEITREIKRLKTN
jgi:hypothetical protein